MQKEDGPHHLEVVDEGVEEGGEHVEQLGHQQAFVPVSPCIQFCSVFLLYLKKLKLLGVAIILYLDVRTVVATELYFILV